jgi:ATP-binding cassette subfamily B protein
MATIQTLPKSVCAFLVHFVKKQFWSFLFITITATIASLASNTLWPLITGNLVDAFNSVVDASKKDGSNVVYKPLIVAISFWIMMEFIHRLKGILLGVTMPKFEANIRTSMFRYVSNHSHSYFTQKHVGGISQRISDMPKSAKIVVDDMLTIFIPLIISIIVSTSVFFSMHPILSCVFCGWLVLHIGVSLFFCLKSVNQVSIQSQARALLQGKIVDSMTNNLSVKIFTGHSYEMENIQATQLDEMKKYRKSLMYIEKFKIVLSLISIVSSILLMYQAIQLWQQNKISVGDIVFAINSMLSLTTILWFAGDEISYMFYELGFCKQSLTLLQAPSEIIDTQSKELIVTEGKIEFKNVNFTYRNNNNIFKDKSLTIQGKEKIGLVGFSGSGKTTFANLIMRLYEVSGGEIRIDEQNIAEVSLNSLRKNITFIPQDPYLFHRSILENIGYGDAQASIEQIKQAAKKAKCDEFITKLEHGYDTIVGERGSRLSGGQRQRIVIARALLKDAPIVIMDEATSALDSVTEKLIDTNLKKLLNDKTVIVIAHRLSTLLHLDKILVFEKGTIVEEGTHTELLAKKGLYHTLWSMQQSGVITDYEL